MQSQKLKFLQTVTRRTIEIFQTDKSGIYFKWRTNFEKKYQLNGDRKLKFRILAFGSVDGQYLVLNLGFGNDPKSEKNHTN